MLDKEIQTCFPASLALIPRLQHKIASAVHIQSERELQ